MSKKIKHTPDKNDKAYKSNPYILKNLRNAKNGDIWSLHSLGSIYESGIGTEKDLKKAVKYYEDFYKKLRNKIDIIQLLINIGDLHKKLGNKAKAHEFYCTAGMEILSKAEYARPKLMKVYKIEKLIKSVI